MGWRLAEEVACARPENPGPEWWTLIDIAMGANDETRRGWPGREYLMARAKKSPRTIDRYVAALVRDGHLVCVKPAGRGARPVYEIPVLLAMPPSCATNDGARTAVDDPASCATNDGARSADDRAPLTMAHDPATGTAFVRQNDPHRAPLTMARLPSNLPSVNGADAVGGAVEGGQPGSANGHSATAAGMEPHPPPGPPALRRKDEEKERQRQLSALAQWERQNASAAPA